MKNRGTHLALVSAYALLASLLIIPPAKAATVVSSNTDLDGMCTQTVDNASSVVVNRYGADCVISFRRVGTTVWTIPAGVTKIQTLIVAGGGGGGYDVAGGGGAGGLLYYGGETPKTPNGETLTVTSGTISIDVGGGGAGATSITAPFGADSTGRGGNGSNSSITLPSSTVLTAIGGGGGNSRNNTSAAQNGGSGGGGGYGNGNGGTAAGNGTGSGTTLQGFAGGRLTSGSGAGGGGGGAGGIGVNWSDSNASLNGAGGPGLQYLISGVATYYGGGGGAGSWNNRGGPGGIGGGGAGGSMDSITCRANCSTDTLARTGSSGTANTGGGGGGSGNATNASPAGSGGSGIVIIRYSLNLASTTTIAVPGGGFTYNTAKNISATTNTGGFLTFLANGKFIPGCRNILVNVANSFTGTCAYKPRIHGTTVVTVNFRPNDSSYSASSATSATYFVASRSNRR
jgi:hypothetical protein